MGQVARATRFFNQTTSDELQRRHAGERRHPEHIENNGFRLPPGWGGKANSGLFTAPSTSGGLT